MEGGIGFGLGTVLHDEVTLEAGRVVQSNFHDYPLLRIHEMPEVEVHIVRSTEAPTGVGEPGVPPIGPPWRTPFWRSPVGPPAGCPSVAPWPGAETGGSPSTGVGPDDERRGARVERVRTKRAAKFGFCAGVRIADQKVKKFAAKGHLGDILGQVVHNERVVEEMEELGVHTVESLESAERGTIVFSAHGVPPSFHQQARARGLSILDTTCPFVYDIHDEAGSALARASTSSSSEIPPTAR